MSEPMLGGGGGPLTSPSPSGDTSPQQVGRAALNMYESSPAKGGRKLEGLIGSIEFQFNPKEVTIAKTVKWDSKPATGAKKAGPPEFKGPEPGKLTLEMFFDATANHDRSVVAAVEKLFSCCVATAKTHANDKPMPPLVVFKWGAITSFPAYVTSVSAKYTLFSSAGVPIRATCTVSLQEMPGEMGKQNPTSGALATRSIHRMVVGDTLASVAYGEYGDPTLWRQLASFNRIDDPMRIPLGSVLLLPSAAELTESVN